MENNWECKGRAPLLQYGWTLLPRPGSDDHHLEAFVWAVRRMRQSDQTCQGTGNTIIPYKILWVNQTYWSNTSWGIYIERSLEWEVSWRWDGKELGPWSERSCIPNPAGGWHTPPVWGVTFSFQDLILLSHYYAILHNKLLPLSCRCDVEESGSRIYPPQQWLWLWLRVGPERSREAILLSSPNSLLSRLNADFCP